MHVAIIMDGNGRWAERRGLPRQAGHRAGAKSVRRVVETAAKLGVDCLTLYAFSSDNWSRPRDEVSHLMRLFKRYLQSEITRCADNGIRLNVIGRRDRLRPEIVAIIERAEQLTAGGKRMLLRLAVDYSARHVVASSAHRAGRDCGCIAAMSEPVSKPCSRHRCTPPRRPATSTC
jgi:undecaprenyl diphosphate synthase